jgi:hypothetical protein
MSDIISNECFKYSFAIKSSPEACRKQISPKISINVLFDFFKTLNTGEPENEGDPPVFNQDTDDLNNIINAPFTLKLFYFTSIFLLQ